MPLGSADSRPGLRPRDAGALLAFAVVVRAIVAHGTEVPGRDAAAYLWIADQVAAGSFAAAFETAFHPLYSLLIAALLVTAPGLDTVVAGQIVSAGLGALAVLPLAATAQRLFGRRAALGCGGLYGVGIWFARHPADCLSEGPFYLFVAAAVWLMLGVRGEARGGAARGTAVGVLAGLAFATRPEGASLVLVGVPWLWVLGARRIALAATLAAAAVGLLCSLGYWRWGVGFVVSPKIAFNYEVGIGRSGSAIGHYLAHLVQVPGDLFEVVGYVALPMALHGLWLSASRVGRAPMVLVVGLVGLQVLVIPLLRSHFRFVSGYGCLLLVFAGLSWQVLSRRLAQLPRWGVAALVCIAVAGDLARIPQTRRADRRVLIDLGAWLRPRLGVRQKLATEMIPRLEYFAGQEPAPNVVLTRADVLRAFEQAGVGFAVAVRGRTGVTHEDFVARGYRVVELPDELEAAAARRGLLVYARER